MIFSRQVRTFQVTKNHAVIKKEFLCDSISKFHVTIEVKNARSIWGGGSRLFP